jgi:nucleotide-binding universal stress UspA family protein
MDTAHLAEQIVVPLDGSPLAEQALPVAVKLAAVLDLPVALVRIIPPDTWMISGPNMMIPAETYQEVLDAEDHTVHDYIERMAEEMRRKGATVVTYVDRGQAAPALLEMLPRLHARLIVMTTHGRTGMARVALGSVADHLVRHSHTPTLVLRPPVGDADTILTRAIVPLDGSPVAEASLDEALRLAGTVVRQLTLVRVIDPDRVRLGDDEYSLEAARYLEQVQDRLQVELAGRDCLVHTEIVTGDPAQQIIRRAERDCDLVILATRGQTGARRLMFGSTADRVLHDTTTPLLLIHPPVADK